MSLYKRGNVWWAYFYIDGVRQQQSTGTGNKRQAEAIAQKLKEEANSRLHQIVQIDPGLTFTDLATRFVTSGTVRPHHLYHLKFLLPYFGNTAACRISKSQAADFRKSRRHRNPQIKDSTVNRDLSVLRHILYWGVDESLLAANPLMRMKMERERRTRRQVLGLEEEAKLLPAASSHLQDIIIAALDTGMRRGEITHQLWEDIDLSRRLLYVTRSKTPKGEAREIPLTHRLYELLLNRRQESGLAFQYRDEQVRIIKRAWQAALRRAGLRHIRFHDLRHTFNTRLMEAGVMQEVRMALMGHSGGNTVHSTYTHVELPVKREAIARLARWVEQHRSQEEHCANFQNT